MTFGGLCVMVLSIGSVLSMLAFCLYKVFTLPSVEDEPGFDCKATAGQSKD
ncbi:MAG: hypothetical protein ACF8CQ_12340 [Rhodopirellula sp. JB044]|uniref:hypothetical protein n=1 Tax=Rhodopirellula sp. JB044 TaxID=3342844 RepID=UPI00370C0F72